MSMAARLTGVGGLQVRDLARICSGVNLRRLFVILTALAMLFAPLTTVTGGAMAMAPADHQAQMIEKGHCSDQPAEGKDGKTMGKSCCVAMCTAVAVVAASPVEPITFARIVDRPALAQFHHDYLAKLATPPPRPA